MSEHFNISEECSAPQRRVFEVLNRSIDELGITKEELDTNFRYHLMKYSIMVPLTHRVSFVNALDKTTRRNLFRKYPDTEEIYLSNNKTYSSVMNGRQDFIETSISGPGSLTPDAALMILHKTEEQEPAVSFAIMKGLQKRVGRFQDSRPNVSTPETKQLYDVFLDMPGEFKSAPPNSNLPNILETFAEGKPLFNGDGEHWDLKVLTTSGPTVKYESKTFDAYVANALQTAFLHTAQRNPNRNAQYDRHCDLAYLELENALKGVVGQISLEEFEGNVALQEEQRRIAAEEKLAQEQRAEIARAEAIRKADEALLVHVPYGLVPSLRSLSDRATRAERPELHLADTWQQIKPLTSNLNRNFAPHLQLGDTMFANKDGAVLQALESVASASQLTRGIDLENRAPAQNALLNILTTPIEELAPVVQTEGIRDQLIEKNLANHAVVVESLTNNPLLLIATLGSERMMDEARECQRWLYPKDKKSKPDQETQTYLKDELKALAAQSVREACQSAGREIPQAFLPVVELPKEEQAKTTQQQSEQGSSTTSSSKRKPLPATREWEEIQARTDGFVADCLDANPPYNMLRCTLGMQPGHTVTINLSRWVDEGERRKSEDKDSGLTLLLNEPSLEKALETKKRLQSYLFNQYDLTDYRRLHEGRYVVGEDQYLPNVEPVIDPTLHDSDGKAGKIMKQGGVYVLKLIFPPKTDMVIPLGVSQTGDYEEANTRRLQVLDELTQARSDDDRLTNQDVRVKLQQSVQDRGQSWQQADAIDLHNFSDVATSVNVNFPRDEKHERTRLLVGKPVLQGTPNAFWSIPIAIEVDEHEIAETRINTHISDAPMAISRINEITDKLKQELESHGVDYPNARWQLGDNQRLAQLDEEDLQANRNVDWTRLDRMKDKLGYVRRLAVHSSVPNQIDEQRYEFSLSILRDDKSPFFEQPRGAKQAEPVERAFVSQSPEQAKAFQRDVHVRFHQSIEDAYKPERDKQFEPDETQHLRQAPLRYDSRSIINRFNAAVRDTLAQEQYSTIEIPPQTVTRINWVEEAVRMETAVHKRG